MVAVIPPNPDGAAGEPASTGPAAVAGLAREVDRLRRELAPLLRLPSRVDELARLLTELAETVTALTARKAPTPAPSWLLAPTDPAETGRLLDELAGWLGAIYLRYPDAVESFPDCWCWHPDVVEELLWLMHAWSAAYQGSAASVALAGDWHDRQRPGVVRRIQRSAGTCSRENHQDRPGWPTRTVVAPTVPAEDEIAGIADWWATRRDQPAPEPTRDESAIKSALAGGGKR